MSGQGSMIDTVGGLRGFLKNLVKVRRQLDSLGAYGDGALQGAGDRGDDHIPLSTMSEIIRLHSTVIKSLKEA